MEQASRNRFQTRFRGFSGYFQCGCYPKSAVVKQRLLGKIFILEKVLVSRLKEGKRDVLQVIWKYGVE